MNSLPKNAIMLMITSQDWGGAQLYVFELAKELKARGEKVIVVAGGDGNPLSLRDISFDKETYENNNTTPNIASTVPKSPLVKEGHSANAELGDLSPLVKEGHSMQSIESVAPSPLVKEGHPAQSAGLGDFRPLVKEGHSMQSIESVAPSPLVKEGHPAQSAGLGDFRPGHELSTKCLSFGIPFVELKHMSRNINPLANIKAVFELVKLFRELEPKAVHLNSTMMGVVGSLSAKLAKVPKTVYCIGGWVFNEDLPSWKKKLYIWIERVSANWKDVIITVHPGDEALAKELKIKAKEKIVTIPNGIDVKEFESGLLSREIARERLGIHPEAVIAGTIANAYPPKNLLWYLEVCKKVHEADKRICFVIMGDGPQFEALQKKRDELGVQNYVMLTGRKMDAPTLYRAFDMFVLPSSKEGMSITLLEAMSAKVPIVATDVGGAKWMLEPKAGLVVPPKDIKALGGAILELAKDPIRGTQLADKAYEAVKERFRKEKVLEESLEVLTHPLPPLFPQQLLNK